MTTRKNDGQDRPAPQETRLRASEEWFRNLAENAPFGMAILDPDNRFEYVNPKFTETFGYVLADIPDREAWLGKAYPDPLYREKVMTLWKADLLEYDEIGEARWRTYTVACRDGQEKTAQFRVAVLKDGRQFLSCEDLTDREMFEDALRVSEEKYQTVLGASPDPVVIYDMQGHATYINPAFTRVFGWEAAELLGNRIEFVPEGNWIETRGDDRQGPAGGELFRRGDPAVHQERPDHRRERQRGHLFRPKGQGPGQRHQPAGHHRKKTAGSPALPGPQNGGRGHAGRRHRPRFQQHSPGHLRLHPDPDDGHPARRADLRLPAGHREGGPKGQRPDPPAPDLQQESGEPSQARQPQPRGRPGRQPAGADHPQDDPHRTEACPRT